MYKRPFWNLIEVLTWKLWVIQANQSMCFHILSSGLCFWKVMSRNVFAVKEEALVQSLPSPKSSWNSAILGKFSAVISVMGFSYAKPYINWSPFLLWNSKLVIRKEKKKLIGSAGFSDFQTSRVQLTRPVILTKTMIV